MSNSFRRILPVSNVSIGRALVAIPPMEALIIMLMKPGVQTRLQGLDGFIETLCKESAAIAAIKDAALTEPPIGGPDPTPKGAGL